MQLAVLYEVFFEPSGAGKTAAKARGALRRDPCGGDSSRQVAAVLGLQTYCVQSLRDAGLIEAPANVDAALLAQEALITKESADRFMLRFARVPLSDGGSQIVSFREAMRNVLAPDLWVQGFEGLLSGALRLAKYAETDACLADRLYVYDDDFEHLRISDDRRDPPNLSVSASEAAELLNVSNTAGQRFSALMKARGFKAAGDVYNTLFWRRADAELALASRCSGNSRPFESVIVELESWERSHIHL